MLGKWFDTPAGSAALSLFWAAMAWYYWRKWNYLADHRLYMITFASFACGIRFAMAVEDSGDKKK